MEDNTATMSDDSIDFFDFRASDSTIQRNSGPFELDFNGGSNNMITANTCDEIYLSGGSGNTVEGNTVGKIGIYDQDPLPNPTRVLANTGKTIYAHASSGVTIQDNELYSDIADPNDPDAADDDERGIRIEGPAENNTIENNRVEGSKYGIYLDRTAKSLVKGNTVYRCLDAGITLENSSENEIRNNDVGQTGFNSGARVSARGIVLGNDPYCDGYNPPDPTQTGSKNNVVAFNDIWSTYGDGIYFPDEAYGNAQNSIHTNTINGSTHLGIYIGYYIPQYCSHETCEPYGNPQNVIFNNSFMNNGSMNNGKNAEDEPENQTSWTHIKESGGNIVGGPYLGGNYWDDYDGVDTDNDGLGNSPYKILDYAGNVANADTLPLTSNRFARILVQGSGDDAPVPVVSQGDPEGAIKVIDALWKGGVMTGDNRQTVDAGTKVNYAFKATGWFGVSVRWTGCDETTGNGTEEAVCILNGPMEGGTRVVTANVTKTPYRLARQFGTYGTGDGQLKFPEGVAVGGPNQYVYVADTSNHRIQVFDKQGNFVAKWGSSGSDNGLFSYPSDVAVDAAGNVYVADTDNYRIQKFDPQGNFIAKWGSNGTGDAQFSKLGAIALDPDGQKLYVLDNGYNSYRIKVFSATGDCIAKWDIWNEGMGVELGSVGDATSPSGYVYISRSGNQGIHKFLPYPSDGLMKGRFGETGAPSNEPGLLTEAGHLAVDKYGHSYVIDVWSWNASKYRIQKFDANGNFIDWFGEYGKGDGQFTAPSGIAVDSEGNVYVTNSQDPHRVQVFTAAPLPPLKGDLDGDGRSDMKDAVMALQVQAQKTPSAAIRPFYADSGTDVNSDGRIGPEEALYILQGIGELRQ